MRRTAAGLAGLLLCAGRRLGLHRRLAELEAELDQLPGGRLDSWTSQWIHVPCARTRAERLNYWQEIEAR